MMTLLVHCYLLSLLLLTRLIHHGVHSQDVCPVTAPDGCTCEGAESISCVAGEQDCSVGNFVFSAQLHSYSNPGIRCGECESSPRACADEPNVDCSLRYIYCLRPYASPSSNNVPLTFQGGLTTAESITFEEGFIATGDNGGNFWNRSNPFTRELQLWPGRAQFYIIVYSIFTGNFSLLIVDRFLIDLELNISPGSIERTTYNGIRNVAQFDLSFGIRCSNNYYGPQCNVFSASTSTSSTSPPDGLTLSQSLIGGVAGGVLAVVLLLIVIVLLLCCLLVYMRRKTVKTGMDVGTVDTPIEMTQNQVYRAPLWRESASGITMDENMGYDPLPSPSPYHAYEYI